MTEILRPLSLREMLSGKPDRGTGRKVVDSRLITFELPKSPYENRRSTVHVDDYPIQRGTGTIRLILGVERVPNEPGYYQFWYKFPQVDGLEEKIYHPGPEEGQPLHIRRDNLPNTVNAAVFNLLQRLGPLVRFEVQVIDDGSEKERAYHSKYSA